MSRICWVASCVPLLGTLFTFLANAPISTAQESNFTYSVYVSKSVRPGFDIALSVSIRNSENDVNVTADFRSSDNAVSLQNSVVVASDTTSRLVLGTIPLDYSGSTDFNLTVVGFDVNDMPGRILFVNGTRNFQFERKAVSLLIQTDKPIYRPGQTIKFRAACLTPDLRPLRGSVSYQVQDPKGNVVLLEPNVTSTNGVAGGELSLTRQAAQGEWKITFQYLEFKETISVSVEIDKLPRFAVEVECPQFLYPDSPGITITLKATYASGQPVFGKGKLSLYSFSAIRNGILERYEGSSGIIKTISNFTGNEKIFLSLEELTENLRISPSSSIKEHIPVVGEVTEGLTGLTYNDSAKLETEKSRILISRLQTPSVIKPGLLYQALIQVSEHDGSLLMEADREKNNITVTADFSFSSTTSFFGNHDFENSGFQPTSTSETFVFEIPPNGLILINITVPMRELNLVQFSVNINKIKSFYLSTVRWSASPAKSPSNSFIQITASGSTAEGEVTVGDTAEFLIRTTEEVPSIRIMIISKGVILVDEQQFVATPSSKQLSYSFLVTHEMSPSLLLLASYIRDDNEVVADYVGFDVALTLENQVSISVSDDSVDAGTEMNIRVQTSSPGSYVGIRAIDKSVLLLSSGNDITRERVVSEDESYSKNYHQNKQPFPFFYWFPLSSGATYTNEVFNKAGIITLTNTTINTGENILDFFDDYLYYYSPHTYDFLYEEFYTTSHKTIRPASQSTRVRSLFPETWLWDDAVTDANGSVTFNEVAPDTITSWIISTFSLSEESGLGIADNYRLTVFRKFFVSLNLPPTITRGEIAIVQATIFNYFNRDLRVTVIFHALEQASSITLVRPTLVGGTQNGQSRLFQIPANSSVSVKYPVFFHAIGEVPMKVTAESHLAIDVVERKVFVRPEGTQQCYTASTLMDLTENNQSGIVTNELVENLIVTIPNEIVRGSSNVQLHVYGNILGSSLNNLGRLLKTPGGTGEQNMINFAPDVFVTLYLQRSNELDADIRNMAFKHIMDGYMNELNYKRGDGSFSAFGDRDKSGSTWLTAFVTKCFLFANKLQSTLVEASVINRAIKFLVKQQDKNGSFTEPGRVIHREMQSGVNSPITMTAYVLISLTETDYITTKNVRKWSLAIRLAQSYLERNFNRTLNDTYALSLVTYALQLTGSSLADHALNQLEIRAEMEDNATYWHIPSTDTSSYASQWRPPYQSASTNDIEMTSYALLTYINHNDIETAIPVLKWLVSKQNELGGYSSTQDTVLTLQALSEMASLLSGLNQNLRLSISHSADKSYHQDLIISNENSIVYNSLSVPNRNGTLSIRASGSGIGVAQLSVCYNILSNPYEEEPFNCTVEVTSSAKDKVNVEFCCSSDINSEPTGMFLFEVGLLNGFTSDVEMVEGINPMSKMVELDDDSINVYYDELTPDRRLCAVVQLQREYDVGSVKPAALNAFDYYKPERKVTLLYNDAGLSNAGACEMCGSECAGCLPAELRDWSEWTPCNDYCGEEISTRSRDCYDPNFEAPVLPARCGLTAIMKELKACNLTFECPEISLPLWFDFPANNAPIYRNKRCRVETFREPNIIIRSDVVRSPRTGIPGKILNGMREYIRCPNSIEYKPLLVYQEGFTLSLLINPPALDTNSRFVYFSIGTLFHFEKDRRSNSIEFNMSTSGQLYTVNNIPILPIGQWSHIVITWNLNETAQVYINGTSVGNGSIEERHVHSSLVPFRASKTLYFGKSSNYGQFLQDFPNAAFSSFKFWKNKLPEDQRNNLIQFYQDLLSYTDDDPIFTIPQLRSFVQEEYFHCFNSSSTLSAIYSNSFICDRDNSASDAYYYYEYVY